MMNPARPEVPLQRAIGGLIRVEILDFKFELHRGFSTQNCDLVHTSKGQIWHTVTWSSQTDVGLSWNKLVRLCFYLMEGNYLSPTMISPAKAIWIAIRGLCPLSFIFVSNLKFDNMPWHTTRYESNPKPAVLPGIFSDPIQHDYY